MLFLVIIVVTQLLGSLVMSYKIIGCYFDPKDSVSLAFASCTKNDIIVYFLCEKNYHVMNCRSVHKLDHGS